MTEQLKALFSQPGRVQSALRSSPVIQRVIADQVAVIDMIANVGEVRVHGDKFTLCQTKDLSDDVFFVLSGVVSILKDGVEIARRGEFELVGEMSLLRGAPRRSATMQTVGDTAVLVLSGKEFCRIADKYPELWRGVCLRLADRLNERDWMVPQKNDAIKMFFGSSSESGTMLDTVLKSLSVKMPTVEFIDWRKAFRSGQLTLSRLLELVDMCDFALFIFAADDITTSRTTTVPTVRENVMFETGLFMGQLGHERVIPVVPSAVRPTLPSDLASWNWVPFDDDSATINTLVNTVQGVIADHGARARFPRRHPKPPVLR